jgi:hypothetical protein
MGLLDGLGRIILFCGDITVFSQQSSEHVGCERFVIDNQNSMTWYVPAFTAVGHGKHELPLSLDPILFLPA